VKKTLYDITKIENLKLLRVLKDRLQTTDFQFYSEGTKHTDTGPRHDVHADHREHSEKYDDKWTDTYSCGPEGPGT